MRRFTASKGAKVTKGAKVSLLLLSIIATNASAQTSVTPYLKDVARVESWSFFEPRPGGGDPDYSFFGNRITLGVRVDGRRIEVDGAFQYAQLLGLPPRSIGPGALGTGALYYDAAGARSSYQLYFRTFSVRLKDLVPGLSVTAGRMGHASGRAGASSDAGISAIRRLRLEGRLLGDFEWSIYERTFNGARIDFDRPRWAASGSVLLPSQGGFEESANATITKVRVLSGAFTLKPAAVRSSESQVFAHHYRDRRPIAVRPDNSGRLTRAADISIATFGASHVASRNARTGSFDWLAWAAGQTGDWYGQSHRAFSVALEGGYQWPARWKPWLRAGFSHASGDADAADDRHGTFFQMLPTMSRYASSMTYAQMNVRDVFAQALLRPHARVSVRGEIHRVTLADAADRWYSGSGATSRSGRYFGYTARLSAGARGLGTIVEGAADVSIARNWSINGYAGFMRGGPVVRSVFAGDRLRFFFLENVIAF